MNHCRSPVDACRAPASVGSARLRTVRSSPTTSTLSASAPSAHQRRFSKLPIMAVTFFLYSLLVERYTDLKVTVKISRITVLGQRSHPSGHRPAATRPGHAVRGTRAGARPRGRAGGGTPARFPLGSLIAAHGLHQNGNLPRKGRIH